MYNSFILITLDKSYQGDLRVPHSKHAAALYFVLVQYATNIKHKQQQRKQDDRLLRTFLAIQVNLQVANLNLFVSIGYGCER